MSVFLAIDLDGPSRSLASAVAQRLAPTVTASWVREEKLHLTVVFLGSPGPDDVARLATRVDDVARRHRPFQLELAGVGTFETARAAAVLWLGVTGELDVLHSLHHDAAQTLLSSPLPGLAVEERSRPYVPHVTLARAKHEGAFDAWRDELARVAGRPFVVEAVTLFEARHDVYRPLHRAALKAPVPG